MPDITEQNSCAKKPCLSKPYENLDSYDVNAELRGRPILYTGVVWIGILRRFLIPHAGNLNLSCEPQSEEPVPKTVSHSSRIEPKLLQITNKSLEQQDSEQQPLRRHQKDHSLSSLVSQMQETSEETANQLWRLSNDLSGIVRKGKTTSSDTINNMRAEHALMLRCGAITLSGLVSYLAGLRRGSVTGVVYFATGSTAMAAVCYPEEAIRYNSRGLAVVRQVLDFSLDFVRNGAQRTFRIQNVEVVPEFEDEPQLYQNKSTKAGSLVKSFHNSKNNPEENKLFSEEVNKELRQNLQSQNFSTNSPNISSPSSAKTESLFPVQYYSEPLPYSPALPVPPKIKLSDNHSSGTHQHAENNPFNNVTHNTQKLQTRLHTYSSHEPVHQQANNNEIKMTESINIQCTEDKSNIHKIYTPAYTDPSHKESLMEENVKLDDGEKFVKSDNFGKSEEHPLNKKLNRFYVKRPEETLANPEKGYDDLYSKRR